MQRILDLILELKGKERNGGREGERDGVRKTERQDIKGVDKDHKPKEDADKSGGCARLGS